MTSPIIVLDRQHVGKPSKPLDLGAADAEAGLVEAVLTRRYLATAEDVLRAHGCIVVPMSDGAYEDRHARACALRADVYVAAHVNAGKGLDGYAFYDHRSTGGRLLAGAVAVALDGLPEIAHGCAVACAPDGPWKNPYATIRGVYQGSPVGICFEPCFIDTPGHRPLLTAEGLVRVGQALALGILRHLELV